MKKDATEPQVEQYDSDGKLVSTGHAAVAAWMAQAAEAQEHNRRVLAPLEPHELARLEMWLRTRTRATPPMRPRSRTSSGRAPREATNARQRGSRRGERSTSSSSDDPGPDPEPPERRLCENKRCEADITHRPALARYCDDACQQEAYRDRLTHEHLDELNGTVAVGISCKCAPKGHLVIGGMCFSCGHPRGVVTRGWLDDNMRARSFVSSRAPARRNPRLGDRKRKPVGEFVDKSIIRTEAA